MSKREDSQSLTPQMLIDRSNILKVTSHIDKQTAWIDAHLKSTATILHEDGRIYYLQALLDSLSSSCSMFKYFFDICIGGNADQMHELMLTPEYIVGITAETLFLVTFALFSEHITRKNAANGKKDSNLLDRSTSPSDSNKPHSLFSDDFLANTNPFVRDVIKDLENTYNSVFNVNALANAYPYVRDVMKGLKNAYKGWRGAMTIVNLFHVANASALIFPVGLGLGVVGAANRYWMRSFREMRKAMKKNNGNMYSRLESIKSYTVTEKDEKICKDFPGGIQQQKEWERYFGYAGSALGGFVDGLYLYMGALTLSVLAPELLIAMSVVCTFYTFSCVITRIYEEYIDQTELLRSKTTYDLLRKKKIIQMLCEQINRLEEKHLAQQSFANAYETGLDTHTIQSLKDELSVAIYEFDILRSLLYKQDNTGYGSAFLLGLQNSLFAYSALSSILFLSATFLTLCGIAMPSLVLAPVVFSGLIFMIGFITHTMLEHYQFKKQLQDKQLDEHSLNDKYNNSFDELCIKLRTKNVPSSTCTVEKLLKEQKRVEKILDEQLLVDIPASEKSKTQARAECVRFIFSGISKSLKLAEFSGNMLQEQAADGHYYDTSIIFVFAAFLVPLFTLGLSGRSLAKEFSESKKSVKTSPKHEEKKYDVKPIVDDSDSVSEKRSSVVKVGLFARTHSVNFIPNNPAIVQGFS